MRLWRPVNDYISSWPLGPSSQCACEWAELAHHARTRATRCKPAAGWKWSRTRTRTLSAESGIWNSDSKQNSKPSSNWNSNSGRLQFELGAAIQLAGRMRVAAELGVLFPRRNKGGRRARKRERCPLLSLGGHSAHTEACVCESGCAESADCARRPRLITNSNGARVGPSDKGGPHAHWPRKPRLALGSQQFAAQVHRLRPLAERRLARLSLSLSWPAGRSL